MQTHMEQVPHWLFLAASIWILIIVMIPFRYFKRIWLPAFITGFIMTYLLNYLAVEYLGLWSFPKQSLAILQTPLFLAVAWYGSMAIFNYLVLVYSRYKILIIFGFSLVTAVIFADAAVEKHLYIKEWSFAETVFMAVTTHSVSLIVLRIFVKSGDLQSNEKPLG